MKVFACKRQGCYSGGLILVAAPTKEEAFNVFAHDKRFECMVQCWGADGSWADIDDEGATISSDDYPLEEWFEIECLTAQVSEPQVIEEAGYGE